MRDGIVALVLNPALREPDPAATLKAELAELERRIRAGELVGAAGRVLSEALRAPGAPAARLQEISKSFVPGVPVLDGVSLEVAQGEVLALLGENGAGKSTLMNVLAGLVKPDAGALELAGERVDLARWGPRGARDRGVGMVHQHSALVPAFTVAENLCFGDSAAGPWFRPGAERRAAEALSRRFELEVPVDRRVEELSPGQRQRAEILRALGRGARLLILDEPTAVLTPGEATRPVRRACGACATPAAP